MENERAGVLKYLITSLDKRRKDILEANEKDRSDIDGLDISLWDRLKVSDSKIDDMITSLKNTMLLPDPDNKVIYEYINAEGLVFKNTTVPFGTILIIYESRPDVTIEAAAMAFKSGNSILLKGGKESRNTNLLLVALWQDALLANGFDIDKIQYLDYSREQIQNLISKSTKGIDLIIPRGGDALIKFVTDHSVIPVIISGRGNNFAYVHDKADVDMALDIIKNGKSRLSVCNAIDKVLIDAQMPNSTEFLSLLIEKLKEQDINVLGNTNIRGYSSEISVIKDDNILYEEFLSNKIYLKLTSGIDEAIVTINQYCGGHSAVIVTEDHDIAKKFMQKVDCAAVYHNASTRFTDGGQVGFGGEMAISTQKLHFRGPVGMAQLVTNKWFVYGNGHIRN